MLLIWFLIAILFSVTEAVEKNKLVFVILTEDADYFYKKAEKLKSDILKKSNFLTKYEPIVYLSNQDLPYKGSWTIFPMIPDIVEKHENNTKFILFCLESTHFNLENLEKTLEKYNVSEDLFIGHALVDKSSTSLHHYASFENFSLYYPNLATGFILSTPLLKKIGSDFLEEGVLFECSIDVSHELALFIYNSFGINMINDTHFCINEYDTCASYVEQFKPCDTSGNMDNIYFAVKTCKQFYDSRIPVVKQTWAKTIQNIEFFSDSFNPTIPTIDLKIENTDSGHCAKTIALLHYVAKKIEKYEDILWVAIVDDDTIISPKLLIDFLSCFNASEKLLLGERYGYRAFWPNNSGVNFVTGGAGMILSRTTVMSAVKSGICKCETINAPDDMHLSRCVEKFGGKIIHSSKFHQARPPDYAENYLLTHGAISFHKHWLIDPIKIYNTWFSSFDKEEFSFIDYVIKKVTNMFLGYFKLCKHYIF